MNLFFHVNRFYKTLQLLCIDSSKFDNRDNHVADIYLQLVKKTTVLNQQKVDPAPSQNLKSTGNHKRQFPKARLAASAKISSIQALMLLPALVAAKKI
ncbi:NACHT C-terminal alpha/beta 1 domain-containing protein [Planktothrix sp. PCC 11201]|uniref:NACHT C-terminal alpha/beta 1 domain-containing protein n=1 Tax=Planktothrix sp. PCC 11201 TaxID=1729650 RepID=UPI00403F347F